MLFIILNRVLRNDFILVLFASENNLSTHLNSNTVEKKILLKKVKSNINKQIVVTTFKAKIA